MVVVGIDGYILLVLGFYLLNVKNNDVVIIRYMVIRNFEGMNDWL